MASVLALAARRIINSAHTETTGEPRSLCIGKSEYEGLAPRLFQLTLHRYVHMLERQQSQLIAGIQSLYQKMKNGDSWTGPPLDHDAYGQPLTHKILQGLGVLGPDHCEGLAAISPCLKVPGSPSPKDEVLDTISPSSTDSQLYSVSSISRKPSMPQPTLVATARSDLEELFDMNDPWTSPPRRSPPPAQKGRGKPDMVLQMPPPLSAYLGKHSLEFEQNFGQIMGLND